MKNESVLVAVTMPDNSVQIMCLATLARGNVLPSGAAWFDEGSGWWYREPTPQVIASEIAKACGPAARWRVVTADQIKEKDRVFRGAWRDTGAAIEPDLELSKVLKADMIRKERKTALEELDAQFMRALGQGNKIEQDAVEAERQKWRDAPTDPRIAAATTVEDLKQIKIN